MYDKNTNESDIDKLLKEFFKLDGTMSGGQSKSIHQ